MRGVLCIASVVGTWQLGKHQPANFTAVFWLETWFVPPDIGRLDTALAPHAAAVDFFSENTMHPSRFVFACHAVCAPFLHPPLLAGVRPLSPPMAQHSTCCPPWQADVRISANSRPCTSKTENSMSKFTTRRIPFASAGPNFTPCHGTTSGFHGPVGNSRRSRTGGRRLGSAR